MLSSTAGWAHVAMRSSRVVRRRWCRRLWPLKIFCSKCLVEKRHHLVETSRDSRRLFIEVWIIGGWFLSTVWRGCLFRNIRLMVLAFEHDDVLVVLVDLSVCVWSPQALDFPRRLLLHVVVLCLLHFIAFYITVCFFPFLLLEFYFSINHFW